MLQSVSFAHAEFSSVFFNVNRLLDPPAIAQRRVGQERCENAELRHDSVSGNECRIISIHLLELLAVSTR